jgi:hypothetical protein
LAALLTVLVGVGLGAHALPDVIRVGSFSTAEADASGHPRAWQPISFSNIDNKTTYRLVRRDSTQVVKATSDGGASGLVREQRIDPKQHPIIEWRWRVSNVLEKGNVAKKSGDDYPARIYITFDYDPSNFGFGDRVRYQALQVLGYDQIPTRALNYIWASTAEKDTIVRNPYTDWVQMIPAESGPERTGQWVRHRRNIREDYRDAFGEEPPPINGVAIMTDTDNTGESATAYYGDIVFRSMPAADAEEAK